jgi:hypothetical protein
MDLRDYVVRVGSGFKCLKILCFGIIGLERLDLYSEDVFSNLLAGLPVMLKFILPFLSHLTRNTGTYLIIGHCRLLKNPVPSHS